MWVTRPKIKIQLDPRGGARGTAGTAVAVPIIIEKKKRKKERKKEKKRMKERKNSIYLSI